MGTEIPPGLTSRPQWILWRGEKRGEKITKRPINPHTLKFASVTNPKSWGTYEDCEHRLSGLIDIHPDWPKENCGLGFVFTADDPFCGIDLDKCIHQEKLDSWASARLAEFSSYTEISPSGDGLHIIIEGRIPDGKGHRKGSIEVYDRSRFFTVTGNSWFDAPVNIEERQEWLDKLLEDIAPKAPKSAPNDNPDSEYNDDPERWEDVKIVVNPDAQPPLKKFIELYQGDRKFKKTWEHDRAGEMYDDSPSTYDMALARIARDHEWTNQEIVDLLIYHRRENGLDKLEREDYYQRTIFKLDKLHEEEEQKKEDKDRKKQEREKKKEEKKETEEMPQTASSLAGDREANLKFIHTLTRLHIDRWVQFGMNPASYGIYFVRSANDLPGAPDFIAIKNAADARSQVRWQDIAQERTRVAFPTLPLKRWHAFLIALGNICEYEEHESESETPELRGYLLSYGDSIAASRDADPSPRDIRNGQPFWRDGHLYFTRNELFAWFAERKISFPRDGILGKLRGCGAVREKVHMTDENKKLVQKDYWKIILDE